MRFIFFALAIFNVLLCSCSSCPLSVQTEYLHREKLASYHVNTPDPLLDAPLLGQKLLVDWSLTKDYLCYEDLHLDIIIRFWNHQEFKSYVPIAQLTGTYLYEIRGEQFSELGGIQTYKVDLVGSGCILDEWKHQLWVELIKVGESSDDS